MCSPKDRRSGFSLIELLVCIAIIGILMGLTLTVAWRARLKALQTSCLNSMRQIGMAMISPEAGALSPMETTRMGTEQPTDRDLWRCPVSENGYGKNKYLGPRNQTPNPAGTVLLYESKQPGYSTGDESDVELRHFGGANFVYVDGHAQWGQAIPRFKVE